jgi:NTE family protein
MSKHVKIGLALGSGSARGFSHIGVIRVLKAEGIPINCVAGTSIGAIIGSIYAAGALQNGEELLEKFDWKKVMFLIDPLLPLSGLLGGKPIEKLLNTLLQEKNIEDFPLPFAAVAADVATGEEVVLTKGNAVKAVRASMSLPGIFTPVFFQGRFLVDGGIVSPVPVRATKMLGADIVIAVSLAAEMSSRTYISTVKDAAKQFQAIEKAQVDEKNFFENLLSAKYLGTGIPEFLKDTIEKGKSFVEERTQALEQWFDEKVERGRAALKENPSFFREWLIKEDDSADLPDIFSVLFNSMNIMQFEIAKSSLHQDPPDILLSPELGTVRLLDFDKAEECIQEGERVARAALPKIKRAIENKRET